MLEAVAVFEMNVEVHPASWIAYDSLAEGYMKTGDERGQTSRRRRTQGGFSTH